MAITQAICNSFKTEVLQGVHVLKSAAGDTLKIALYTSAAAMSASTTTYAATNEASGAGYTAGGAALTIVDPTLSGSTAVLTFSNVTWASSTITARGALIYNTSKSNKAIEVLDFGADKSSSGGDFTITFPTADAANAIIRLG